MLLLSDTYRFREKQMIQKISNKSVNGKIGAVMVLGAGVSGIQASLDLA